MQDEILSVTSRVIETLDKLGIPYVVCGSIASSAFGLPRSTMDADIIVNLTEVQIPELISLLRDDFYIDAGAMRDAIKFQSSFNIIHYQTSCKIDCYILKRQPYEQIKFSRRRREYVLSEKCPMWYFLTPEDSILSKLQWYQISGGVSERQWRDIIGVLEVQGDILERSYLEKWSQQLGLTELLQKAIQEAEG